MILRAMRSVLFGCFAAGIEAESPHTDNYRERTCSEKPGDPATVSRFIAGVHAGAAAQMNFK